MNIIDSIQNNPYRVLGVYVGSPVSMEVSHKNMISAFARVGQQASFSFPIDERLEKIERNEALAEEASRILAIPADRLKNALFWIGEGDEDWSKELSTAVCALLDGNLMEALYHYGNLFYDDTLRSDFQVAATKGLTDYSPEELTNLLCSDLIEDKDKIIAVFKQADQNLRPNPIIRHLCNKVILRNRHDLFNFHTVITHIIIDGDKKLDFYTSFRKLKGIVDELIPLADVVGGVYGKESPQYEDFAESIMNDVYGRAKIIVEAIGKWTWVCDYRTMKEGQRIKLMSERTRRSVESCMGLIRKIDVFVNTSADRLHLSARSLRILHKAIHEYDQALEREYIRDESQIRKAVRRRFWLRLAGDIAWFAAVSLVCYIIYLL